MKTAVSLYYMSVLLLSGQLWSGPYDPRTYLFVLLPEPHDSTNVPRQSRGRELHPRSYEHPLGKSSLGPINS